jgi:hypothetical protein
MDYKRKRGWIITALYTAVARHIMINPLEVRISAVKPDKSGQDSEDYNDTLSTQLG